jgi:8-oxo-dGTP diphosphatase
METLVVAAGLITNAGRILVTQRKQEDHWGLCWEFPGGKLEQDEAPDECLRRELREELGIDVSVGSLYDAAFHRYDWYNVLLLLYRCSIVDGVPRPLGCHDIVWVDREAFSRLTLPPADEAIRRQLLHEDIWDSDAAS